ncbi:c-type cytochrome [Komagataeibacter sucrofermentans]|uniref:Alcohol dehydrogenase n=1 Tax=Komagataeibacter sucrofermentans TaxID=1053551 RepID=A0A318QJZ4_9PROT|nr:cytochrome c [Komagataeibacter sucrofermentans]PYD78740.1 alcohol dehydrogenase [Komagataeibacter sucrofermentans]GBQ49545.1 cytochrome c precursor [Komagataeibacter sucrofermentans DSM 15973]
MRKILLLSALAALPLLAAPVGPARADSAAAVVGSVQPLNTGEDVYRHVCQGCHMPDGKGAMGAGAQFPAFAGNAKLQSSAYPVYVILNGYGGMPWFSGTLKDDQIANVVNYIRTHFGNHYTDAVSASDVAAQRPPATPQEQ